MNDVTAAARAAIEGNWDPERGYAYPHPGVYPHQWLWDSCFNAIVWAALGDPRCVVELHNVFRAQLEDGFVPHMRYTATELNRGPLRNASSYTQPPMYAHAARVIDAHGFTLPPELLHAMEAGLNQLWETRGIPSGLLKIVHPWESGADRSPRWDSWRGADLGDEAWAELADELIAATLFNRYGAAVASTRFEVAPAAFNALAAHAAHELSALTGQERWEAMSRALTEAIDAHLWNAAEGLWSDLPVHGARASAHVPTLDGVLGALVTDHPARAHQALDQMLDESRFSAPYGPAYVARSSHLYRPHEYWRGSSWMQLNYLVVLAARRWQRQDVVRRVQDSVLRAIDRIEFSEHWDPETREGLGARPYSWSALVVTMLDDGDR